MLDEAIEDIAEGFVAMGIIESSPSIIAFYERNPTVFPDELGPSGERMRHAHLVGAKVNGEVFLEYSSEIVYFPPRSPNIGAGEVLRRIWHSPARVSKNDGRIDCRLLFKESEWIELYPG